MTPRSAREIDDEAGDWALKLGDEPQPPGLREWLAADPRCPGALLRAQAALSFIDRARALESELETEPAAARPASRRRILALAGAGGLAAAGAAGAALLLGGETRYATDIGEIRRIPLKDGSIIQINTTSVLDVALRDRSRDVVLKQGEAWFQVAKDASRPFLVKAGDARFRAVGTAFSVRRLTDDRAELLVTEGVVEAWRDGNARVRVAQGDRIVLGPRLPLTPVAAPQQIERDLAWRNGQIALDNLPLAQAAAEFNRYNRRRLVIEDPALANRQFVGLFRLDDPKSFAMAVAAGSGAKLVEDGDTIRIR